MFRRIAEGDHLESCTSIDLAQLSSAVTSTESYGRSHLTHQIGSIAQFGEHFDEYHHRSTNL